MGGFAEFIRGEYEKFYDYWMPSKEKPTSDQMKELDFGVLYFGCKTFIPGTNPHILMIDSSKKAFYIAKKDRLIFKECEYLPNHKEIGLAEVLYYSTRSISKDNYIILDDVEEFEGSLNELLDEIRKITN